MKKEEIDRLLATIELFDSDLGSLDPLEAETTLMSVLHSLLAEDGYEIVKMGGVGELDFVATSACADNLSSQTIGIEFKYYRSSQTVGVQSVNELLNLAVFNEIDRGILLSNTRFTKAARDMVRCELPVQLELIDLDSLRGWVKRLQLDDENLINEVTHILKIVSQQFARLIAKNPNILEQLEWRDLERTVAEIFDGLGFHVTLTPSSKDGGKDVILECWFQGCKQHYIVEIKHWRCRSRVGCGDLRDFLNVIIRERRDGGLFLSTYGFCDNAFEQLTEIERQRLRVGEKEKILSLSRTYVKAKSGIWSPPERLAEVLFEETA